MYVHIKEEKEEKKRREKGRKKFSEKFCPIFSCHSLELEPALEPPISSTAPQQHLVPSNDETLTPGNNHPIHRNDNGNHKTTSISTHICCDTNPPTNQKFRGFLYDRMTTNVNNLPLLFSFLSFPSLPLHHLHHLHPPPPPSSSTSRL
ncbi:hypothetical protein TWF569_005196 [Orbilia oligospora]|nr:hypothetical protein TWF569_005196 [Orbilia oligospora]